MDYLFIALQNLTAKENYLLRNKIRNQGKKKKLLQAIQESENITNKELSRVISYGDKMTNLYALKNRLLNDLISVKLELNRNEIIETKEMVQNIRAFVYSKDKSILIRQLRMLQKKCIALELYAELREVYFCYKLINRHDSKKTARYEALIAAASEKQQMVNKMEEVFYFRLLNTQDLFYYPHQQAFADAENAYKEIERIHKKLNNKSSVFLALSSELTLKLNHYFKPQDALVFHEKLILLSKTYQNSFVEDKYPNCKVAIECLHSRYYLLMAQEAEFMKVQNSIREQVKSIQGYQMFDSSFLYYAYAGVLHLVGKKNSSNIVSFIEETLPDDIEPSDLTTQNAFQYLIALKEFYKGNYPKSSSILLKSRIYFSYLDELSSWSAVENILLNIVNCVLTQDTVTIDAEISMLKRIIKKYRYGKSVLPRLRSFFKVAKSVKDVNSDEKLIVFQEAIESVKKELHLFNLIVLTI